VHGVSPLGDMHRKMQETIDFAWLFGERGGTRTLDPMIKSHAF
jgi:hypothetical protein